MQLLWKSGSLGDTTGEVSWSPSGEMIAVGVSSRERNGSWVGQLFLFNLDGKLLIKSRRILGPVRSVSWSPNGNYIAVGTAWTDDNENNHGELLLFSANGTILWRTGDLGKWVLDLAWSPDGSKIAVVTGWGPPDFGPYHGNLIIYSKLGSKIWESRDLGRNCWAVDWSPDGSKIAVGRGGAGFGKVIVFSPSGKELYSIDLDYRPLAVSWSPDSKLLAVGGRTGAIQLFNNKNIIFKYSVDSAVLTVQWSTIGNLIAIGDKKGDIIILNEQNIYSKINLNEQVRGISWSPKGDKLAASVGDKVIVFLVSSFGTLRITGPPGTNITITGNEDTLTKTIPSNTTITLYASPGEYTVEYALPEPGDYVGDPQALRGNTTVTVEKGETTNITIPSIDKILGTLKITTSTSANITIKWSSGQKTIQAQANQTITLYASPGKYTITYTLPRPGDYIGSRQYLGGEETLSVGRGEIVEFRVPQVSGLLGQIRIEGAPGVRVSINGSGAYVERLIPDTGELVVSASPGSYRLVAVPPPGFLGLHLYSPVERTVHIASGGVASIELSSFPRTPLYYLLLGLGVATLAGVAGGVYSVVRGRFVLEDIKGEIISGVGGALRVRVRNPGLWDWRGRLAVRVDGMEVYSGEVRLARRESKVVNVRFSWTPELGPRGRRSSGG